MKKVTAILLYITANTVIRISIISGYSVFI